MKSVNLNGLFVSINWLIVYLLQKIAENPTLSQHQRDGLVVTMVAIFIFATLFGSIKYG